MFIFAQKGSLSRVATFKKKNYLNFGNEHQYCMATSISQNKHKNQSYSKYCTSIFIPQLILSSNILAFTFKAALLFKRWLSKHKVSS